MRTVVFIAVLAFASTVLAQGRVAVWNPEKGTAETRFRMDVAEHDRAAEWLRSDGIEVARVTAEQIADSAQFGVRDYSVLVLAGEAVPRAAFENLKRFASDGGVLVAMNATVPFLIGIAREPDGSWTMSPKSPTFAWQSEELLEHFGLMYVHDPARHNLGYEHRVSPLLKPYLHDAVIQHQLPSRWVVPHRDEAKRGTIYPLIRSKRLDGKDAPPQVFIAEREGRHAIICISGIFTAGADEKLWPASRQTLLAMVRLAADLHAKRAALKPEDTIDLPHDMPAPPPLAQRPATQGIEPPGVRALARWGRFNGSCLELPEVATPESPLSWSVEPGRVVRLPIPQFTSPLTQLRIRVAYVKTGGVLRISTSDRVLISEHLSYLDAGGMGNYDAPALDGVAAEITRIVLIGTAPAGELELYNPGTEPFFVDAIQVEVPDGPQRTWQFGLNANQRNSYTGGTVPIPLQTSRTWDRLRGGIRTQFVGEPGKPGRWDRSEKIIQSSLAMNDRVELILEGTPPWAAISPQRLEEAKKAGRPHVVPPDPAKYAQIVREIIARYGDRIDAYEIWNEPNIIQFWRGSADEYVTLFKAVSAVIRESDPTARIILAGMAGVREDFLQTLAASGVFQQADLVSIHPYAGKSPAWDIVYGQFEGLLMSLGVNREIYSNESGFPWRNTEWFTAPPALNDDAQARLLDVAMARITASGATKVVVFHCGGDDHEFALFDQGGRPRPAYKVFEDYLHLSADRGEWSASSLVQQHGEPLKGVYSAASRHADGSFTAVINSSENADLQSRTLTTPAWTFDNRQGWVMFGGKANSANGRTELLPDQGKQYIGFYTHAQVDRDHTPVLRLNIAEAQAPFRFSMTIAGKEQLILPEASAGIHQIQLADLLPPGVQDVQVTFRCPARTVLDDVRFTRADGSDAPNLLLPPKSEPIPAVLRLPLDPGRTYTAQTLDGKPLEIAPDGSIHLAISGRLVIHVKPTP